MSGKCVVLNVPMKQLTAVLRGELELVAPSDAEAVAAQSVHTDCGDVLAIRVHSNSYKFIPDGHLLPVMAATLRRRGGR